MEEIDLRELFDYFKTKIISIIVIIVLLIIVGNVYTTLTRKPMYKSDTTIVLVSETNTQNNYTDLQMNKNLVDTYSEIIKSRKVLNPVIKNLKLKYSYGELKEKVSVSPVTNTEIIRVSVSDRNPKKAKEIANEIGNVFSEKIQKIYNLNNVSIVDKAIVAKSPYNINYIKDNLIYVAIGIVLSCGLVFIKFYFDTTIKTSEEIENKLGLTVIGIVPKVEKE